MTVITDNAERFMTEEQRKVFDKLIGMHLVYKEIFKANGKTFSTLGEVQEYAFEIGASSFYIAKIFRRAGRGKISKYYPFPIVVHFIDLVFAK